MPTICPGVDFDTIAREWRCKWSEANDKKSLEELQKALLEAMPALGGVAGSRGTQRIVCGGCLDFKVITAVREEKFGAWEEAGFAPEAEFLEAIKKIDGVTAVETQTYTSMPVRLVKQPPPIKLKKVKTWDIGRLNPDGKGFTVMGKLLDEPKEVETKGTAKIFECTVGDATGKIVCSLKQDQMETMKSLPESKVATFRNARVVMVKGHMRLMVDKWGKITATPDEKIETVGDKNVSETEFELVKEK
jgi:hypothetical protein